LIRYFCSSSGGKRKLNQFPGPVHAVSYSASPGTYILTGSSDRSIRLYNPTPSSSQGPGTGTGTGTQTGTEIPQGRLIQTYSAHGYEVLSLSVSSDNSRFVSSGGDRAVFLWDVSTAQTTRRFGGQNQHGHTGRVNAVIFAGADDSLVISGGLDTTARIWDTRSSSSSKPIQILEGAKDSITSLATDRDAAILVGSVDGRVRSYDVRIGRMVTDVVGASVTSLCMSRDGRTVLVGSLDSRIRLFDRSDGKCLKTYYGGSTDAAAAEWRNEELRVQSVLGGKERFVVAGDELTSPGLGGGNEGRVWAWDLMTGKLAARLAVPWGPAGSEGMKRVIGKDGKAKERKNVVSCIAWKEGGFGNQFCVGGTSGVVTVFGEG